MSVDSSVHSASATAEFDVGGKVVLLTGASSGLGAHFARRLRAAGAEVYAVARRGDRLEALADEVGVRPLVCDVSDAEACRELVASTYRDAGRIDILINNAGYGGAVPAEEQSAEDFKRMLDVNLVAPFILSQQLVVQAPVELDQVSIINIASILGLVGVGRVSSAAYAASKGGILNLTRELAVQWARRGVRVNAIAPGWFESEATEELFASNSGRQWLRRSTPMGRGGAGNELDGALLFLASSASSFVTGQVVVVDGGWTAT
jgi:NAD(P)-dependent dehydrogenase (short-subunit alcohol dehydrogenase family)